MSFHTHWLDRLTSKFLSRTTRRHHSYTRHLEAEMLEGRRYLSATMILLNDGHTLSITGDSTDNRIEIVQDEGGLHVTADRDPTKAFNGIDSILVSTGSGNDDVRVINLLNPPSNRSLSLDLRVSLGVGDDSFVAEFPPDPCRIGVDGGLGNDSVTFRSVSRLKDRPSSTQYSGIRDSVLYANLGDGNDSCNADLQFPPDPCMLMVLGGGGADSINALIGLLSNATPASDAQGTIDISINGGDGNDFIQNAARNLNLNGRVTIDLQGGAGNDIVQQTLDMVTVNAGLVLNANGGVGDDYVVLSSGSALRSTGELTPTFYVNSQVQLNLQGDLGNDRLIGLLQPCIMPAGSLDMAFSGGSGNDVFNLMLGLEEGTLNPPSESEQDGPISLVVLGGDGDDQLNLSVLNLGKSASPLELLLDGGLGRDTAVVTAGINAKTWTD